MRGEQISALAQGGERWTKGRCHLLSAQDAILRPDGTYVEAGGRGRWWVEQNVMRIRVVQFPSIEFMSAYPKFLSLDEDGKLPFFGRTQIEAVAGPLARRFQRCG